MFLCAAITFDPAMFAAWLCGGLAVGWFAGKMTEEPSYGAMGDFALGMIGGFVAGLVYCWFKDDAGFGGSSLVALGGALVLIVCGRAAIAMRGE